MREDVDEFEGLVHTTASKFASMVGLEEDDFKQEMRLTVLKATRSYDPARCRTSKRAFVFSCLSNRVKDLKRDRARRAGRLHIAYIEGFGHKAGPGDNTADSYDLFEYRFMHSSHDEIYAPVEDEFVMPATVTSDEQEIVYLLVIGYAQTEIAETLAIEYAEVVKRMRVLREKFRDWKPSPGAAPSIEPSAPSPQQSGLPVAA